MKKYFEAIEALKKMFPDSNFPLGQVRKRMRYTDNLNTLDVGEYFTVPKNCRSSVAARASRIGTKSGKQFSTKIAGNLCIVWRRA